MMEDADKKPKRRAQDQRQGRGEKGRGRTGAQESAEEATGQWDARRIVGTASKWGRKGSRREAVSECGTVTEQSARS